MWKKESQTARLDTVRTQLYENGEAFYIVKILHEKEAKTLWRYFHKIQANGYVMSEGQKM